MPSGSPPLRGLGNREAKTEYPPVFYGFNATHHTALAGYFFDSNRVRLPCWGGGCLDLPFQVFLNR